MSIFCYVFNKKIIYSGLYAMKNYFFLLFMVLSCCDSAVDNDIDVFTSEPAPKIPYLDVFKSLGSEHSIIWVSQNNDYIKVNYCLPDFYPYRTSICKGKVGYPTMNPLSVSIHYKYPLHRKDWAGLRIEGLRPFILPFPININIDESKTPYARSYEASLNINKRKYPIVECNGCSGVVYDGLTQYTSPKFLNSWRLWVPKELNEYSTKLGNPYLFSCSYPNCTVILDQGNGWIADVYFNELALNDWRNFIINLEKTISYLM